MATSMSDRVPDRLPLGEINAADDATVIAVLRPCLDVDRWVAAVADGRPYPDLAALLAAARSAAVPLTSDEVDQALSHHPRIGERAAGASAEAALSRSEQGGLTTDEDTATRLAARNRSYEKQFGRVFLIRAAGRSSEEILAALEQRLGNDPATEAGVVADQLRQIALLRLEGRVDP